MKQNTPAQDHNSLLSNLSRINWQVWLPSRGNAIFTLVVIFALFWAQSVNALPWDQPAESATSTGTWPYQGRLADGAGNPITNTVPMIFRLYNAPGSGAAPLWEEQWTGSNSVQVSDGLFNIMLGSLSPIPQNMVTGNASLWLGITVGTDDEMVPRVQLGSVPFAVQALTVPNNSITSEKLADGSVTQTKLGADISLTPPDGSITNTKITEGAVSNQKIRLEFFGSEISSEVNINTTTKTLFSIPVTVPYDSTYMIILNISTALDRVGDRAIINVLDNGSVVETYHISHSTGGNNGSTNETFLKLFPFTPGSHTITVTVMTVYETGRVRDGEIQVIPFSQFTKVP